MVNNKDKVDEIISEFYREKLSRLVSSSITKNVMERVSQEESLKSNGWIKDNLWIIVMVSVTLLVGCLYFGMQLYQPIQPVKIDLMTSLRNNQNFWIQFVSLMFAGGCIYFIQVMIASNQTDLS